jgi:hypothetical protein
VPDPTAPERITVDAHAKLNLFLRVLAREADGYHQLETAFALIELADELTISRIEADAGVVLEVDGPDLGPAEENLAVRAARAVLDATGNRFGVRIALTKRIPARAGLGGARPRWARSMPSRGGRCRDTSCCISAHGWARTSPSSYPARHSRSPGAAVNACIVCRRCRPRRR